MRGRLMKRLNWYLLANDCWPVAVELTEYLILWFLEWDMKQWKTEP